MFLLIIFTGFAISIIGYFFFKSVKSENREQVTFYKDASCLTNQDFCLYLRSFQEDIYKVQHFPPTWAMPFGLPKMSIDLQVYFALRKQYPVIKVTNTITGNESIGFSQIKLEEDWKIKISDLLSRSKHIIIKPSVTKGLVWELDQIFDNNYIQKTIFIGSFGDVHLKEVEKIYAKRFFQLLKIRYGIYIGNKSLLTNKSIGYYFTIENCKVKLQKWSNLRRSLKRQGKILRNIQNMS